MQYKTIKLNINDQNVFFISDTHFDHENIIKYCFRPFSSVEEMNNIMIKNWNETVNENDIIFHLGDFCFGSKKRWSYFLNQLNGKKYLVAGNHDVNILQKYFIDVQHRFNLNIKGDDEIPDGQRITVDHYPLVSWYQSHRGSWNLFGHHHGTLKTKHPNQTDVGVDIYNFKPLSYQEIKVIITKQNMRI